MSLTHSVRSLKRTPTFAVTAAVTLAIGIGSAAAAFSIAYGVLLDPLPYGEVDRLVSVALRSSEVRRVQQPPAIYQTYRRYARSLADIGFYRNGNANLAARDGTAEPQRVSATWVTASTIPLLRVAPVLGRSFTDDEDRTGGPDVAIISETVWRTFFQGSPDVIGRTLIVNSVPRTIIGVMPQHFMFPAGETMVWLPARLDRDVTGMEDFAYAGVARLVAGASAEDAQRELVTVLPRMAEAFPRLASGYSTTEWLEQSSLVPEVIALREEITSDVADTLWMLTAAAGLVLIVALANVANLMMIRADARRHELAVREALGASRLRILIHFLGESIVLTAFAGMAALLASWGAVRALVLAGPVGVPRLTELDIGVPTIAFVIAVSLVAALVCTLVPTLRIRRAGLSFGLRDGGRGDTNSRVRQRLRAAIAALQVAVAFVAVAGSVLLFRTFQRLSAERPGFDTTDVVTLWTQLPFARYGDSASVAFYERLAESVSTLPGVVAVGLTTRLPLGDGETRQMSVLRDERNTVSLPAVAVDSGYFAAMRIPVVAGPGFRRIGGQRGDEVVLSRRAMQLFQADTTSIAAIGRQISLAPDGPVYTIVGVVGDVRDRDRGVAPAPTVYTAQAVPRDDAAENRARRTMALVVRTQGSTAAVIAPIRGIVRNLDPAIPIFNIATMGDIMRASTARLSLTLTLMGAAAAITLLLGAVGLYGVMDYTVALRTRELGIRIAIGADPARLARSVALGGLKLLGVGVAAGLALYGAATPFLRSFVYGVTTGDPVTLAGATAILITTALVATWLPARRASRVDPNVALRAD